MHVYNTADLPINEYNNQVMFIFVYMPVEVPCTSILWSGFMDRGGVVGGWIGYVGGSVMWGWVGGFSVGHPSKFTSYQNC